MAAANIDDITNYSAEGETETDAAAAAEGEGNGTGREEEVYVSRIRNSIRRRVDGELE